VKSKPILWLLSALRKIVTDAELYKKERELFAMQIQARELHQWCAYEFPEVGCAAKWMLDRHDAPRASGSFGGIACFRQALRDGSCDREAAIQPERRDGTGRALQNQATPPTEEAAE